MLAIFASGMVTGLGFSAPATLAALRAGISAVRRIPWFDLETAEPLSGAKVPLPHWWEGVGKLADLVAPAIHECCVAAHPLAASSIPVLIGVASHERPGRTEGLDDELLDEIEHRLGSRLHPRSALFPQDQFGCVQALIHAHALITQGHAPRVIVAGVDSFLHGPTLHTYIRRRRLMTPTNSNGFFPGEAGTAVLVGDDADTDAEVLRILGIGIGEEPATIESTMPLRAAGLTQALQQALRSAGVALKDVAYRITDLSGEHYKFKEAAFAACRLNSSDRDAILDLWHPIEYLGHIGAAVLPCLLAQAMHAAQEGYAPGALAACHLGNDAQQRAALIVGLRRRRP